MSFELFVEVMRNEVVESRHFGVAAVCDFEGNLLHSWGDVEQNIFVRSAIKPMLAIDVVQSGAAEHFQLSDQELALACASHQGESIHQNVVKGWLNRLGLGTHDLICGEAWPDDVASVHKIIRAGKQSCRIHHNCSGKHAAYLTNALHLGLPIDTYQQMDHPLQKRSLEILSDLTQVDVSQNPFGIDGCGLPAPTIPLKSFAHGVARFAKPVDFESARTQAIYRLHRAMTAHPLLCAGNGNIVSDICAVTKGAVLPKTGAEGVLIAAIPERGIGVVLKIADGSPRSRGVALLAILNHLGVLSSAQKNQLSEQMKPKIRNSRHEIVGLMRPSDKWLFKS